MKRVAAIVLGLLVLTLSVAFLTEVQKRDFLPEMPVSEENPMTVAGVELGRKLFYDTLLSGDGSMSCGSCHIQEFAFSGGNVAFNQGVAGVEVSFNTPPLFNLAWYERMTWNGRSESIESQLFEPIRRVDEMGADWPSVVERLSEQKAYQDLFSKAFAGQAIDSVMVTKALAQFLRSMISNNTALDQALRYEYILTEDEFAGYELINDQVRTGCLHCHVTDFHALGTTGGYAVNGLVDQNELVSPVDSGMALHTGKPEDVGRFRIPSLRNLVYTAPYMHDGRFKTLREVLDFYAEGVHYSENLDSRFKFAAQGLDLSEKEKKDIITFLEAFKDDDFATNSNFSRPVP